MKKPVRHQASRAFDASEFIDSPAMVAAYLDEAMSDGDPKILMSALRDVLRSRVFSDVAAAAGVSRESLHRTIASGRDARLSTLASVLRVIGCRLAVAPATVLSQRRVKEKRTMTRQGRG